MLTLIATCIACLYLGYKWGWSSAVEEVRITAAFDKHTIPDQK